MLEATFTEEVSYRDPIMQGDGHDGVAALIDGVQQRFAGFRFSLEGQAGRLCRPQSASRGISDRKASDSVIEGTDIGVIENGRLKSVTGFLDKVPAQ